MYEEDLRNVFLILLQTHFEGSATGETFNKKGKTDILLKHGSEIAFIGECKVWRGSKKYEEGVDQLLGNLTWRDSKAALLIFVRDTQVKTVLKGIRETTEHLPNFIAESKHVGESWLNYKVSLLKNPESHVFLAVLVFDIPILN